jgi:hypothetical protein
MECYYLGIFSSRDMRDAGLMPRRTSWDERICKQAKVGDISIKGTAKEHRMKLQRQRFARREAEAAIAVAEIEVARYARLPWPVCAIGAALDFVLRRPSP